MSVVAIARLERTLLARSGVAGALLVAFTIFTALAATSGSLRTARDQHDRTLLSAAAATPPRDVAHLALERGTFAVLPGAPLAGLAVGQSDIHPSHYQITARLSEAQLAGDQLAHPLMLLAGSFDLLFVMLYLFPLLIVAVSHDLLASDRLTGTLRLMVVQGASVRAIVRGRVLARVMLVLLMPVAASMLAAIAIDPSMIGSGRFLLWTATLWIYGAFWLGVALHVNARGGSALGNALVLAAIWLLLVIVVPGVVNLVTRAVYPMPSRVQLATALREASRAAVQQGSLTLGRYLEDHPSTGTGVEGMQQFYLLQEVRDAEVARQMQPVVAAFDQQRRRQAQLISRTQFASPILIAQLALTDVAGTSGHRAGEFATQAARFQSEWKSRFPADVLAANTAIPTSLPTFRFVEESFSATWRRTALPLLAMAALAALLLWLGERRLARFPL